MYADAVNAAIRDVPEDMTVAIHTCRGNFKSTWLASGAYADFVAERVFTGLEVEKRDDLKRRIEAAAKYVPLENLCLSPQCGFSSTHHGNKLSADDQWRKLALVLEVSKSVWG